MAKGKSNELRIVRVYEAPVKAVWDAWTDPKKVAKWWGPRGFTITTHSKDLRVGGHWAYTMHGPDGTNYENKTIYHEVQKHAKLVYDHGGNDDRPPLFRVTVTFVEHGGKTTMDMTMALASEEAAKQTAIFIKKAGGTATWDRLAEYLDHEQHTKEIFVIHRSFDAPIQRVFDMWAQPEHLTRWLPPVGMNMDILRAEPKEGGSVFFRMHGQGAELYGRIIFLSIRRPELLVYRQQFTDAAEKLSRHPMAPNWPETMLTTVAFTAEGPNETLVTLRWEPAGEVSTEEISAFVKERSGMTLGWTGSFDKLEAALKTDIEARS